MRASEALKVLEDDVTALQSAVAVLELKFMDLAAVKTELAALRAKVEGLVHAVTHLTVTVGDASTISLPEL